MTSLQDILSHKRSEVQQARNKIPYEEIKKHALAQDTVSHFAGSIKGHGISIIAEIKKASPSHGVLNGTFNHTQLAQDYETGGARALSVLTDEKFFQGHAGFIREVKAVSRLPVLRKDFIIDEYQIYESKVLGADAVLLIVRALDRITLQHFYSIAGSLGLDVLVEAHTADEVEIANSIDAEIIGINNRDLTTFDVSLDHSLRLRDKISPGAIAVSESGIMNPDDVERLSLAGFDAALVGEGLVTKKDRIGALRAMVHA